MCCPFLRPGQPRRPDGSGGKEGGGPRGGQAHPGIPQRRSHGRRREDRRGGGHPPRDHPRPRQEEDGQQVSCGPSRPERSFDVECLHSVCRAHQIVVFRIVDISRCAPPEGLEPPTLGIRRRLQNVCKLSLRGVLAFLRAMPPTVGHAAARSSSRERLEARGGPRELRTGMGYGSQWTQSVWVTGGLAMSVSSTATRLAG